MNCENCKERKPEPVPFLAHESAMARMERVIKRLWVLLVVLVVLLVTSNVAWIMYESQYEDVSVSQEVDTGEGDALVVGVGDVYGEGAADG